MSNVRRVYVEKKPDFAVKAKELKHEIKHYLGITTVEAVRVLIRYDVENISEETYNKALYTVFSEPPVDDIYEETFDYGDAKVFTVEFLPGQFDQRADSAEQCVKLLNENEEPIIRSAITYVIEGAITDEQFAAIKKHCINPVDSRAIGMEKPKTLVQEFDDPADVIIFDGFKDMAEDKLKELYDSLGLAMTFKDFLHIQKYFKGEEKRDPSMTEIRVLDTYWSDHCRHTTFSTELTNVEFDDGDYKDMLEKTFDAYRAEMKEMYKDRDDKFICLMDIALMGMKQLKAAGKLDDMEVSDEINACSIIVPVEVDGETEEWLVFFKNETHNHPTEIEPFGGAATCLGGAIRDPLSGRGYVYQAMRVTGAADPTKSLKDTLPGKLPQRKIVTTAAAGYSSYGNQIGLATGLVNEIYHPDYVAKRMEIGAVMGAAPRRAVKRLNSDPGDKIILLGGRTGRDGCGGATGSSKAHNSQSLETCGAEVQKGNPPTERKIQRLFRREEVASIIKKCNDFGAGGVSVAIGELAPGLVVDLDKVPKKYAGLDGTELAISESQERMAVVLDKADVDTFIRLSNEENLEATPVAVVTDENRLEMTWRGDKIVDLSRDFLNTNGVTQHAKVEITAVDENKNYRKEVPAALDNLSLASALKANLSRLEVCSQKGLVERFDSSIGASTVLMPYAGKYQLTPEEAMVAKIPLLEGETDTATVMAYGFIPKLSRWSPFHSAAFAVSESLAKLAAVGCDPSQARLTFQEYFERLNDVPSRWGKPTAALLGALTAQVGYKCPSIGGKDSMSGSFNDLDVPPTLVSFAVGMSEASKTASSQFKRINSTVKLLELPVDEETGLPIYDKAMELMVSVYEGIRNGKILSASVIKEGGAAACECKMAFGNKFGFTFAQGLDKETLFAAKEASFVVELADENAYDGVVLGKTNDNGVFIIDGDVQTVDELIDAWCGKLEKVFATDSGKKANMPYDVPLYKERSIFVAKNKVAKPKVFIPVFPGTNCEYDSAKAFERAGAEVETIVFRNMTAQGIRDSVDAFTKAISQSQIIMFPGGFSAGDEPDGSGKFIATAFRNSKIADEVMKLLQQRDGLALGICNGFQALIKLGLVPYGEIRPQTDDSPTLTINSIGRHQSKMVYTKVVTNKSPWLKEADLGGVYTIPISHGEGRFVASKEWCEKLFANGQVATQYVDMNGNPTMDEYYNVNGSYYAIEGITSPDGRVLGKMGHSERTGRAVAVNIYGDQNQKIFESGVDYFK